MTTEIPNVRVPFFPTYGKARAFMRVLDGMRRVELTHLISSMMAQTGTPKKPVSWIEPDEWIPERLKGRDRELAFRIWEETDHLVNPRHIYGSYLLINGYDLLATDENGVYRMTPFGELFLNGDEQTVRLIDEKEGILALLSILSNKQDAKRGDLLPEWSEYLGEVSNFKTKSTQTNTLFRRLANVVERGLAERTGNRYSISPDGVAYLERHGPINSDPKRETLRAIQEFNSLQRSALKEKLAELHPYAFEHLIRDLLEAMGYEDVTVTKEAGDKGVDVIASIQFGITSVREVVQVKRTPRSTLGRPIVDQLRGALHYHQAIQGTIITLGKVGKGAQDAALFQGAAPITLIDGEKLIDLLIDHEVAIKKRTITMWEVDSNFFGKDAEKILE